jgi:predicted esterase
VPKTKISDDCPVVFCADGQLTKYFADQLRNEWDHNRRLVLIGVDHDPRNRGIEYVTGHRPEAFERHELFFTETVFDWVHQEFKLNANRARTIVFGFSCGGSFATSMAVRHPDKYVGAIAMSIAGRPIRVDQEADAPDLSSSRFCLAAGKSEMSGMKKYMQRLEKWLRKQGASCRHTEAIGNHNVDLWTREFGPSLDWLFG